MPPTPSEKQVQTAYDVFLDKGLVGVVALIAVLALIWAVLRLIKSKDDRIQDQTLFSAALAKSNERLAELTVEINKSMTTSLAESKTSTATLTTSVQGLDKAVQGLDTRVGMLRDEQVRLSASLGGGSPVRGGGRR